MKTPSCCFHIKQARVCVLLEGAVSISDYHIPETADHTNPGHLTQDLSS